MAVAALSGVEGSGLESCCDDGSKPCPTVKSDSRRARQTRAKATETPTFNFHRNSPHLNMLKGRARPTVTPAVESISGGPQTDNQGGQDTKLANEFTMDVSQDTDSLSAGPSTSQPLLPSSDPATHEDLAQDAGETALFEDDDEIPFPTVEGVVF
ncbi:unnamed protein product [Agarophyton chilense]